MLDCAVALTPERVRAYREDYRSEAVPAGYRGWLHLAVMSAICLGAISTALLQVESFAWVHLLVVPISWVVANLVEYAVHRGPMHELGALARLYRRHTSQHHRFFSRELMAIDEVRDFHVTLFPAWLSLFLVGLIGAPMAGIVYLVLGLDLALVFYASVVSYYLAYEWIHLGTHMPENSALARVGLIRFARAHHGLHHDPAKMRRANFNFGVPLGDWLFGTWER